MRRTFGLASAAALSVLVLCWAMSVQARPEDNGVPNELPRSWSIDEIAERTPPYGATGRVYVLAWQVVQDERPLRVESCLVLKVLDKDKDYCLAHLYRHPTEKEPKWQLAMTHFSGEQGTKYFPGLWVMHAERFNAKPGNRRIYAELADHEKVSWRFTLEKGYKFVGCGVCEHSWQQAIGEKPTVFFGGHE